MVDPCSPGNSAGLCLAQARTMTLSIKALSAALCVAGCLTGFALPAPAPTPDPAKQPQSVITDLTEPDFSLVNLPTTRPMKQWRSNFHLTHRFLGNLREGGLGENAGNLFGLDNGAVIGLEYRISLLDSLQAVVYRSSADKTIQFSTRFDALRQGGRMPVSVSLIASIEGNQNFGWSDPGGHEHVEGAHQHKSPALAASVSRTIASRVAVYAVPVFVHNSLKLDEDSHRNTFYLGMGGRVRVRSTVYLVAEVSPRLAGYAPGDAEYGFGIEKRAGGHMFQLTFSNATATTFGQIARGGFPSTLYFGFNLSRKF